MAAMESRLSQRRFMGSSFYQEKRREAVGANVAELGTHKRFGWRQLQLPDIPGVSDPAGRYIVEA